MYKHKVVCAALQQWQWYDGSTVWPYNCTTVGMYNGMTVQRYDHTTVRQYDCMTVGQNYSMYPTFIPIHVKNFLILHFGQRCVCVCEVSQNTRTKAHVPVRLEFWQNAHVRAMCLRPKIKCANVHACEAENHRNSQFVITRHWVEGQLKGSLQSKMTINCLIVLGLAAISCAQLSMIWVIKADLFAPRVSKIQTWLIVLWALVKQTCARLTYTLIWILSNTCQTGSGHIEYSPPSQEGGIKIALYIM